MKKKSLKAPEVEELLKIAKEYRQRGIAPYTGIKVGAALKTKSGRIFGGTNIQSIIPDASICAERTAIFKALSEGENSFSSILIVGFKDKYIYPCGTCRQVLSEYSRNLKVITADLRGKYKVTDLEEISPHLPILKKGK